MNKKLILFLSLCFTTVSFTQAEFIKAPCQQRSTDVEIGKNNLYSCGSTSCPPSVKSTAMVGNRSDLPEGFCVYLSKGILYKSSLRNHNPQRIPNADSITATYSNDDKIGISSDGNWVIYGRTKIIKIDGSAKLTLSGGIEKACWLQNSPKGLEIAYIEQGSKRIKARTLNVSGNSISEGTTRTLFDVSPYINNAVLSAGTDVILTNRKFLAGSPDFNSYGVQFYNATINPALLIKVPNNGNGVAVATDSYWANALYPASCGLTVSPDGKLLAGNFGRGHQDCYPENHKGFAVLPTSKYEGDKLDWMSRPGASINWCPESFEGYNLRKGTNTESEFQHFVWSNVDSLVSCIHQGTYSDLNVFGGWVVNWKTNTWYLITEKTQSISFIAVYKTGNSSVKGLLKHNLKSKSNARNEWINLIGKNVKKQNTNKKKLVTQPLF